MMNSSAAGEKIRNFLSLYHDGTRFRYLVRLGVEKRPAWDGTVSCDVDVELANELVPESGRLKLRFMNSTDVRVGNLNLTFVGWRIMIRDISDRQLEHTTYLVAEEEQKCLLLNCEDFEFEAAN
jgi:hypothetical protein